MFYNCNSLFSLELGDFNNLNVGNMASMFWGCNSLTSLDLTYFNILNIANVNDMFKDCNEDLIYCLNNGNKEQILDILNGQLSPSNNNCSHICIEYRNSKFIFEENRCIDNCFNDGTYRFEYNKICLIKCPERTDLSPDQPYLCENEMLVCDIKCKSCTFESNYANLCITCNTNRNYFPKTNDALNINGFINCYNGLEGYYLDSKEKIYKNCFSNCKNCEDFNGEDRNKCNNCYSNKNVYNYNFCFEICDYKYEKCFIKDQKYFPLSISGKTTYSYELNSNLDDLKDKIKNLTFIYLSPETIKFIMEQFKLDEEEDKLIIMISDYPTDNTQKTTNDFDYRIFLENGTELNLSNIKKDFYSEKN